MKKIIFWLAASFVFFAWGTAYAQTDISIIYESEELVFNEKPILVNNKTLVQLRPIAEALDLGIEYEMETGTVYLSNEDGFVGFTQGSNIAYINDEKFLMDAPMTIHNDYTFVPIRDLVEPFGYNINYDGETKTVEILSAAEYEKQENTPVEIEVISTGSGEYEHTFYYQSQPELEFPGNGRGYCWVCSYAMVFSNLSEKIITPNEVAQYNIDAGYSGNFMAGHKDLARKFGTELVPAISESSPYYGGFNVRNRGETVVICQTDEDAKNAIREALDKFPCGVIVRYDGYPHSMVAVSYDEEHIYFNDPAIKSGEHIPFEQTCLAGLNLSDISSIQAFEVIK